MDEDKKLKASEALARGGLLTEEVGDDIKIHLACDPNNPLALFDKINELEIELVKRANNDIQAIQKASEFTDDIRNKAKKMLLQVGIDIESLQEKR